MPNSRLQTLPHHKYKVAGFEILKLSSIYGANGSGKSNLTCAIDLIRGLACEEEPVLSFKELRFKLNKELANSDQIIAIEFFQNDIPFLYALKLGENYIQEEELYISGLGKKNDELIYERITRSDGKTTIKFSDDAEKDQKVKVLKSVLIEDFVKPSTTILKILSNRDNKFLKIIKLAYAWFENSLYVLTPESRPAAFAHTIDKNGDFKAFAENVLCSFNLGIDSITASKKKLNEVFDEKTKEYSNIVKQLNKSPESIVEMQSGEENRKFVFVKESDQYWVKELQVGHRNLENEIVNFPLNQESDGTNRLLDFIPALHAVINHQKVFIIDEIERSIHPLLIKELIRKFSDDKETKGQLIFTTHESNLLDQDIFRRDEIWFTEKDISNATDVYSLSDFKEHITKDICKGYLSGRYGSIPFLGNLHDLNWHNNDTLK